MGELFLLTALCLAFSCTANSWNVSSQLMGLILQHLRATTAQVSSSSTLLQGVGIRTELHGTGSHRTLEIYIHVPHALYLQECQPIVLQPLPSSIYADPYQLEDLTRSAGSNDIGNTTAYVAVEGSTNAGFGKVAELSSAYSFTLLGPLDLELPAPACQANMLMLDFNFTQQQEKQQLQFGALLSVPLHAKYPEPRSYGFTGWQALSSGYVHFAVPAPWLFVDCRAKGGELHVKQPSEASHQQQHPEYCAEDKRCGSQAHMQPQQQQQRQDVVFWAIPAGNLDHLPFVSWGTLMMSAICSSVLLIRALQQLPLVNH